MLQKKVSFKVDEGKVRACSMYHWRRAERKEKASIYYRYCHLEYITGMVFVFKTKRDRSHFHRNLAAQISLDDILFFRGGDVYKGEVIGLQGGPNAISRFISNIQKYQGWQMQFWILRSNQTLNPHSHLIISICPLCWTNLGVRITNLSESNLHRYVGPDDNTLPDGWGEMQYEDGSRS